MPFSRSNPQKRHSLDAVYPQDRVNLTHITRFKIFFTRKLRFWLEPASLALMLTSMVTKRLSQLKSGEFIMRELTQDEIEVVTGGFPIKG